MTELISDQDRRRILGSAASRFGQLTGELRDLVASAMEVREYESGDYLIREGESGGYLLVLVSGSASARTRQVSGKLETVAHFSRGDVVGEISLVTNEARTADVVARTPVHALSLSSRDFRCLAEQHPELQVLMTELVSERLGRSAYDGLAGKDIHGYRINRCVGHGGMGVVYEATRVADGRTVAVKMMNHRLVYEPAAIVRFKREAETLASLSHAAIARLVDRFSAYKTQFLVMEYCSGLTLKQLLSTDGVLDERLVRPIVGQLACALDYVHGRGWLHRDIKPSNVMLTKSGDVKLLDFGLATVDSTLAHLAETAGTSAEATRGWVGTLQYMAPERFASRHVDHRVDVYGLACLAYEALAGRPVVEKDDLFVMIREKERFVIPPAAEIGGGVTPEMHEFLKLGLEPRAENRTASLEEISRWAGPIEIPDRSVRNVSDPEAQTQ